jgi:hypothetical protein
MARLSRRSRIPCKYQCVLNFHGSAYHVLLENLSLDGAFLKIDNYLLNSLKPDDLCDLLLCNDPNLCPIKYSCKVVRLDSEGIGVTFM